MPKAAPISWWQRYCDAVWGIDNSTYTQIYAFNVTTTITNPSSLIKVIIIHKRTYSVTPELLNPIISWSLLKWCKEWIQAHDWKTSHPTRREELHSVMQLRPLLRPLQPEPYAMSWGALWPQFQYKINYYLIVLYWHPYIVLCLRCRCVEPHAKGQIYAPESFSCSGKFE